MIVRLSSIDTIATVAAQYHTTVQALIDTNGLSTADVYEGMRLVVHGYVVLPLAPYGDLAAFCRAYCVDAAAATVSPDGRTVRVRV